MATRTVEEKYKFLLELLAVDDVDFWENDALIVLPQSIYFQFPTNTQQSEISVDWAIEQAMGNHFDVQS